MLRPKLGRIWSSANSVTRRDPGDAKYVIGWLAEIPTYQVLNYLQWKNDTTIQALAERGVFEWGGDVTYKKGAAVWDETNGVIYTSLVASPSTTLKPSSNTAQWTSSAIQLSRKSYDTILANINTHIADVTSNPHKITPNMIGTYTIAQIDALVATYRAEVAAHASDTNNPHKLTAAIIGAVPITGGTYTGAVTMGTGALYLSTDKTKSITSDSTGVYLKNSAGSMGVDTSGKGFVKTGTAAATEIITASTFAANKQLVEPNYALAQPVFYLPFANDINIYIGAGKTTSTLVADGSSWDPTYNGGLVCGGKSGEHRVSYTASPLEGIVGATMAIDFNMPDIVENVATTEFFFSTGSASRAIVIEIRKNNTVRIVTNGATSTVAFTANAWHRVVAVRTATTTSLYLDGVLMTTANTTNDTITGTGYNFLRCYGQTNADRPYTVRNGRMWDTAMTAAQVSNI